VERPIRNVEARWVGYLGALGGWLIGLGATFALQGAMDPVHLPLVGIGFVVGVAAMWGRAPGAISAVLMTLSYDFFFLPPRFSLVVSAQHFVSLVVLLAIALAVGQLAARLRRQALAARTRQENAQATAQLARDLTGAVTSKQAVEITKNRMREIFGFVPEISLDPNDTQGATGEMVVPLKAPRKVRGSMRLSRSDVAPEDQALVETFAAVCALSLERIHFVEVAHDALLRMEGEKMRAHVLSCLSHDLRTPLTGIVAQSGRLSMGLSGASGIRSESVEWAELADSLHRESARMADLVENLLDLARLQSGGVRLRLDWHSVEDLCANALRHREEFLSGRKLSVEVEDGLALVWCDGVLVERVIVNLLDNAHRHTPPEGALRLWATATGSAISIGLDDQGAGLRKQVESGETRIGGIGLSLCQAIARAHGGELVVTDAPDGGSRVALVLPQSRAVPDPPLEEAEP